MNKPEIALELLPTTPTKIVNNVLIVLDESGSMDSVRQATVNGFNEQLTALKDDGENEETRVTLVAFSDRCRVILNAVKASEVEPLTIDKYNPRGSTALFTAIRTGIDTLLASVNDPASNENAFLVVIISDGEENSSHVNDKISVPNRIKELTAQKNWTFTYLGANVDITKIADSLNLYAGNVASFNQTKHGTASAMSSVSRGIADYKSVRRRTGAVAMDSFYSSEGFSHIEEDVVVPSAPTSTPDGTSNGNP